MSKNILLIDGNSLLFKSFYASYFRLKKGEERTDDDEPINAIRLFAFMIINLRFMYKDSLILVAFDAKGVKTFRHEYNFYKANRKKQPDELYAQIPVAKDFLNLFGIKWIEDDEFLKNEADDIIGIYAEAAKKQGYVVDIVTSDYDLLQLVDENVNVHLSKVGVTNMEDYTNENFYKKFNGLSPIQIPDLKGLMGDSSDNLSGIHGIGEKTAINLLNKYYSIERIFDNLEELTGKTKEKILNGKKRGLKSKELAKIRLKGEIKPDFNSLLPKEPNVELKEWLEKKKLFNVIKKLNL